MDWTKLITRAEKEAQAAADRLALAKAELSARNATAAAQIDRITDRVETLGYGIDAGEATAEDEAEQATLIVSMKAWKAYKFALGKVTTKEGWYDSPAWPVEPPIPEIVADPMLVADETT
ncbi:phage tail protein [Pseudomonas sp. NFIX28]|uniref:phage tail protein n=1 Tax=Pseudomonas sp. NFIX28 TaxID=1566235 RepID=UPI00211469AC|nr:phage tail protein [Pseudomonas sp. NFIX28]